MCIWRAVRGEGSELRILTWTQSTAPGVVKADRARSEEMGWRRDADKLSDEQRYVCWIYTSWHWLSWLTECSPSVLIGLIIWTCSSRILLINHHMFFMEPRTWRTLYIVVPSIYKSCARFSLLFFSCMSCAGLRSFQHMCESTDYVSVNYKSLLFSTTFPISHFTDLHSKVKILYIFMDSFFHLFLKIDENNKRKMKHSPQTIFEDFSFFSSELSCWTAALKLFTLCEIKEVKLLFKCQWQSDVSKHTNSSLKCVFSLTELFIVVFSSLLIQPEFQKCWDVFKFE